MQETLYVFRLRDDGGLIITTEQSGSRLPIDEQLNYKPGDWKFVGTIQSADLPNMLTSHKEVEPVIARDGYYSIGKRDAIIEHPFFKKHAP
jgi:hypothetical protein